MAEIFNYIENHDDSQFTLKELRNVLTGYVSDDKTIITRLQQKYLTDVIITTKVKDLTIIFFRDTQVNILSKDWYDNKKGDSEKERLRIVEAAAAIIREDIRSSVVETQSYSPPSKMLIKKNQEIAKSLLHFLQKIIMKNRKGKIANSKPKCTSISLAIMAALRERSFSSQLLLSLSVFLYDMDLKD
ncbi:SWIM-type domain-containing protein [Trichonephila inaurata madagascariensis]|uniref:SWIM-type domain-containing protein n=1 Tax=Trichonephila inaurata madagascariensis TaxID=2747483 RepID=A0A8X6WQ97_9ARAC|nr:SWIM-type domain-containing protein [Trichonephila inaurata madagascariensis]